MLVLNMCLKVVFKFGLCGYVKVIYGILKDEKISEILLWCYNDMYRCSLVGKKLLNK